jgi:AcrR family transcriptional regulator
MAAHRTVRGERRRDEIVAIARRVLVDEGLDQFVMRRIAERAGMQLGNLQYYFPTRDDLLEAVVRAEFARDLAAFETTTDDPARQLAEVIAVLLAGWAEGGTRVYTPLALLALHDARFASLHEEIYQRCYAEVAGIVRRVDPTASRAVAHHRATLISALVDGVSLQGDVLVGPRSRRRTLGHVGRLALAIARGDGE